MVLPLVAAIPAPAKLVMYAGIAGTLVDPQLLAGVGPGIVLALFFAIVVWAMGSPKSAPRGASYALKAPLGSLVNLMPILIIVVVVN